MSEFSTKRLPGHPRGVAPDGTAVRELLQLAGGSLAHLELAPGKTFIHCGCSIGRLEIWYFVGGRGEVWRKRGETEEVVAVEASNT